MLLAEAPAKLGIRPSFLFSFPPHILAACMTASCGSPKEAKVLGPKEKNTCWYKLRAWVVYLATT